MQQDTNVRLQLWDMESQSGYEHCDSALMQSLSGAALCNRLGDSGTPSAFPYLCTV